MDFSGTNSSLHSGAKASNLNINGASDTTVTCWVNADSFNSGAVFEFGNSGTTNQFFALRTRAASEGGGGNNIWSVSHWSTEYTMTVTNSLNNWTFFCVTYDTAGTDTSECYAAVLGTDTLVTSQNSTTVTLNIVDKISFTMGELSIASISPEVPIKFDGSIADVRVYDRVLSLAEMQSIYIAQGKDGIVNGLQGRWPLRDGSISSNPDSFYIDSTAQQVSSGSSLTVTVPTHVDGDLLVTAILQGGNAGGTPANGTTPSGWTLINSGQTDLPSTGSTPSLWIYRRTASSEPASYAFTSNQTCTVVGFMVAYRSVDTTEDSISNINTGTGTTMTATSLTTTQPVLCLRFFACDGDQLINPDDGPTQRELAGDVGVGDGCTLALCDGLVQLTPTNTSTCQLTSDQWGAISCSFNTSFTNGGNTVDVSDQKNYAIASTTSGVSRIEDPLR
jgi:hypothetical protein